MNIFPETTKRDKVIRMFLAFLLVFGILPVSIMADIDEAWATTNEAIKHNEIVARNPLVIMDSRTNWLKHGATRFSPVEVVSSDQPDLIANRVSTLSNDRNLTRYQISRYRTEIINSVTDGETKSGYTIEFPSCVNEGDTATVNLKYPIVGTYNGRRVGAFVTYTLTHQDRVMTPCVNDYAGTMDYTHSAIQLGDSLFAGLDMCNVKYCDSTIEFFYADDNSRVTLGDDAFFTIGSLSWGPAFPMSETAMVLNSKTSKIQIPDANDPGTLGNIKVKTDGVTSTTYAFRDDGWSDVKEDPSFYKQSASFFQAGSSLDFRISAVTLEVDGTEHHGGTMWWSLSSSSIATPEQPKPVKDVDKPEASKGETITYTIEQEVHTAGMDIQGRYASFVFRDSLPQEVDYASGSAKMYQVVNGAESDITASAGSLDYDAASHTLSYIFNHEYLRTMLMQGETYRLVFDTVVKDSIVGNEVIANKAGTIINEHEVETNPALTLINDPRLSLVKKVNAFEQGIGDKALYTLQLSNAVEGTVAKNVVLYDDSLPDHLRFNISSVNVSGIPGAIDYPVVKENVAGTESRANAYRISPSGSNGFQLAIDYLPFGSTVTITYEAEVSAPANVKTTVNTAMASAANADRVQANDIVWVNNAALYLPRRLMPMSGGLVKMLDIVWSLKIPLSARSRKA